MPKYIIRGDKTELAHGTKVYVIPVTTVQPGQLAMYELTCDGADCRIVGRRISANLIEQPKRVIECGERVSIHPVGVVIPVEAPPKEITNLSASEYITALLNVREVKG